MLYSYPYTHINIFVLALSMYSLAWPNPFCRLLIACIWHLLESPLQAINTRYKDYQCRAIYTVLRVPNSNITCLCIILNSYLSSPESSPESTPCFITSQLKPCKYFCHAELLLYGWIYPIIKLFAHQTFLLAI